LEWTPEEKAQLGQVISAVHTRLVGMQLPTPPEVLLVKTSGEEEGGAAYCRGAAIVLPAQVLKQTPRKLDRLIAHEFFHVLSNQNPKWREALYAVVGFQPCNEILLPEDYRPRRITNPDAPASYYYTTLEIAGQQVHVVPVLYSSSESYDQQRGGNLFSYLTFRLMAIEQREDRWQPVLVDGQPKLFEIAQAPAYYDRIGRNTGYIIHPEEVLADNFVLLVAGKTEVPTPRILTEMTRVIEMEGE
jgi:hypothetical protein